MIRCNKCGEVVTIPRKAKPLLNKGFEIEKLYHVSLKAHTVLLRSLKVEDIVSPTITIKQITGEQKWFTAFSKDNQRGRMYQAQRQVTEGERIDAPDEIGEFVHMVTTLPEFVRLYGNVSIHVRTVELGYYQSATAHTEFIPKRGSAVASTPEHGTVDGTIVLPKWAWNERTVLHEIGHVIASGRLHDRYYAGVFLRLIGMVMGEDVMMELMKWFDTSNVMYDFNLPRKRRR